MTETLYLSRARLKAGHGEALAPLSRALLEGARGETSAQAHRIVWMLFSQGRENEAIVDADGKNRLFLWREKAPGEYYILSRKPPENTHGLFHLETKEFAPCLKAGDILRFSLRANPVVTRKGALAEGEEKRDGKGRLRGARCDIVMDALKPLSGADGPRNGHGQTERAQKRDDATAIAARKWIEAQGKNAGFALVSEPAGEDGVFLTAGNYETIRIPRKKRFDTAAKFGVLDFEGLIEVNDPAHFLTRLSDGFGKAKAFGCGLMLIRRA